MCLRMSIWKSPVSSLLFIGSRRGLPIPEWMNGTSSLTTYLRCSQSQPMWMLWVCHPCDESPLFTHTNSFSPIYTVYGNGAITSALPLYFRVTNIEVAAEPLKAFYYWKIFKVLNAILFTCWRVHMNDVGSVISHRRLRELSHVTSTTGTITLVLVLVLVLLLMSTTSG